MYDPVTSAQKQFARHPEPWRPALRRSTDLVILPLKAPSSECNAQVLERSSAEERLHDLTTRLLHAHDEESRRIARELHDSAGQYLAAIGMNLGAMQREAASLSPANAERVSDSLAILGFCISEIRTISYLLHPPLLDELGLVSAVASFCEGFSQRSGIRVELDIPDGFGRPAPEMETAMFRIIQQSLANIYRHSASPVARIIIRQDAGEATLTISDDGCGIPSGILEESSSGIGLKGVGIAGMRERTRALNGTFHIRSSPAGTTISIGIPLTEKRI